MQQFVFFLQRNRWRTPKWGGGRGTLGRWANRWAQSNQFFYFCAPVAPKSWRRPRKGLLRCREKPRCDPEGSFNDKRDPSKRCFFLSSNSKWKVLPVPTERSSLSQLSGIRKFLPPCGRVFFFQATFFFFGGGGESPLLFNRSFFSKTDRCFPWRCCRVF